jgi:hypothetical protein
MGLRSFGNELPTSPYSSGAGPTRTLFPGREERPQRTPTSVGGTTEQNVWAGLRSIICRAA